MRDKENILKSKKEALKKLEIAYKDSLASMNPNQGTLCLLQKISDLFLVNLSELYQEYRKLSLDSQNDQANQVSLNYNSLIDSIIVEECRTTRSSLRKISKHFDRRVTRRWRTL